MKTVVTTQVGADGVLALTVPLAKEDAHTTVRVTVETVEEVFNPAALPTDGAAWLKFVEQMGGSITDSTFERHPQGDYQKRDPLT